MSGEAFVFANNVNTTLATAANATDTTLVLASSANLPTLNTDEIMPLTLNDAATGLVYEIVYVTFISGTSLNVERAQEGTSAQNWNVGDYTFCGPTGDTNAPVVSYHQPSASETLLAGERVIVQPGTIGAAITLTLPAAPRIGSTFTIFGSASAYDVNVSTGVATGSPKMLFPDGSTSYTYAIPASTPGAGLICIWDGTDWRASQVQQRFVLTADTTFYVSTTGSDSTGAGTSASPWATPQHAIDVLLKYDLSNFTATISVADGTYTGGVVLSAPFVGGVVNLVGDTTTPANCIISTTSLDCIKVENGAVLEVAGFKFETTTTGYGLFATFGGLIIASGNCDFGTCAAIQAYCLYNGKIEFKAGYTISGSPAGYHWGSEDGSSIKCDNVTVTLTGTPNFASSFCYARSAANIHSTGVTFSGAATGPRYTADANGVIQTNGSGASYLPGNSAGSTATGGQYI